MKTYKNILEAALPRLINLYNCDPLSAKKGYGDRQFASWKTIDFANGTFQGGVHAIAAAYKLGMLRNKENVISLIDSIISAIPQIRHANGSLVEAYPNEHSFCVTALVAFDVLSCVDLLKEDLSTEKQKEYLEIVNPLVNFISNNNEEHAIISNHLATGVAAVVLWNDLSSDSNPRYKELLKVIYDNQSQEGWYKEYEGADPGYQTLCTYYLVAAWIKLKDDKLLDSLKRSLNYLKYFIHPDGTIGGLYGSRNTEVFYPGGIVALCNTIPELKGIIDLQKNALTKNLHITPEMIDSWNFIPLMNSYAVAAMYEDRCLSAENKEPLPYATEFEKKFLDSGIYIKSTARYYCIINYKKGGTIKLFDKVKSELEFEDGGIAGVLDDKKRFSTQVYDDTQDFLNNEVKSSFYLVNDDYPGPFKFAILRVLAITMFRSPVLGNIFKRAIVKLLMTGKKKTGGGNTRTFVFENEIVKMTDSIRKPERNAALLEAGKFKAIHMASSGYNAFSGINKTTQLSCLSMERKEI